jgi:GxxExxY protein
MREFNIMEKDPRTHKIIGAAMAVHNEMGPCHLESVYHECLEIEFELQKILFVSKPNLSLYYKNRKLKKFYVADFVVVENIVLEIKAPDNYLMPEKGLKKRWRHNMISRIISANNKGLLTMPFLENKGEYLNLGGIISAISKLTWYIFIGTRLLELGLTVKYIGRYTKKPVIAETGIIRCDDRWVIFKFKDYADDEILSKLGCNINDKIAAEQFQFVHDTS